MQNNSNLQNPSESDKKLFNLFSDKCTNGTQDFSENLITTLIEGIKNSEDSTFQGLNQQLKQNSNYIINMASQNNLLGTRTNLTLKSVASIFQHYISRGLQQQQPGTDMSIIKDNLIKIANQLLQFVQNSKSELRKQSIKFLQNGQTILVYGHSTAVLDILIYGASKGIKFQVIVCECRPMCEGYKNMEILEKNNIPCKLIVDSALGYSLEEADMILVGSEAVVENGGIINRIGTYTVALCAKSLKKPFYVVCESYKFTREFPLSQKDLPEETINDKHFSIVKSGSNPVSDKQAENLLSKISNPICDYTPPNYITLLFTDVGIFTPSAVSDELIQIFNS